jgi:hypothetical protein
MTGSLSTCCLIRKAPSPKGAAGRCARPANNATPLHTLICTIVTTCRGMVAVCAGYPPKMRDEPRTLRCRTLLCDVSKQQLAVLSEKATQLLQLGGVSILLLFQVP